ncbi:MarR family winged helix-turn-helix transcriptional regulator [Microvirga sp. 17 mud 1-3]|uniref:MarR family winged helix-turn-helix transcriptional regulator n=1 Tax=Microvirga sp. 17 mud 1-3 TaxID=2082949 RepID=UPI000D6D592C|nr:MarR family transcriptional regulator [Microvirga sp. 17 mud 1-3]AWM87918.1 MarR family transcriptional regulator [Microvirga sp. 17 mud 1-3]
METSRADTRVTFIDELTKVSRKLRTAFDAQVKARELTMARARTLLRLLRHDGITQTELAFELEIEGPTLVRLLDHLETQRLIERRPVEGDRRAKRVALTKEGRAQAGLVSGLADDIRETVLTDVAEDDLQTAIRVFRAMSRNIEAIA